MSKLNNCQFIEVKIDNKAVAGSSEESAYKNWMEGYASPGLETLSGPDGIFFTDVQTSILVTKETSKLYENYLQRGHKEITITIVHRGSDKYEKNYEIQRTVFNTCNFLGLKFAQHDEKLFMVLSFTFEGTVEVTFNVPNADETSLDKIGPIKYDIPQKKIL